VEEGLSGPILMVAALAEQMAIFQWLTGLQSTNGCNDGWNTVEREGCSRQIGCTGLEYSSE
jgi:hypothetical protein